LKVGFSPIADALLRCRELAVWVRLQPTFISISYQFMSSDSTASAAPCLHYPSER
jgi:hypothetical protein